jgi:hypothetical protein
MILPLLAAALFAAPAPVCQAPILAGPPRAQWWKSPPLEAGSPVTIEPFQGPDKSYRDGTDLYIVVEQNGANHGVKADTRHWFEVTLETGERQTLMMSRGAGPKAMWTFVPEGSGPIYLAGADGKAAHVGEHLCKRVTAADYGIDQRLMCMSKGTAPDAQWTGDDNAGKVYQESESGKLTLLGAYARFWVTPQNGPRLPVPITMSKGTAKDAAWCGEWDGVLYTAK